MDLKKVAQAVAGALDSVDYGKNVNGGGADLGHIRALSALTGEGNIAAHATGAVGTTAGQQAANEDEARRQANAEAAARQKELQDKLKNLQDPNSYQRIVNDVGGYDFFDPLGNKISGVQYAQAKNEQVTDAYKDSQDANDQDFLHDYDVVTQLGRAIQAGDAKARDKIYKENPDFQKAYHNWTFSDIVSDLHNNYPGYFRSEAEGRQEVSQKAEDLVDPDEKKKNILQRVLGLF